MVDMFGMTVCYSPYTLHEGGWMINKFTIQSEIFRNDLESYEILFDNFSFIKLRL